MGERGAGANIVTEERLGTSSKPALPLDYLIYNSALLQLQLNQLKRIVTRPQAYVLMQTVQKKG